MQVLTPLTSSSQNVPFLPYDTQKKAFESIKQMLLSEPLFCNLIEPNSTKYIFVDTSTSTGYLGAVLLQQIDGKQGEKLLPTSLDLDDPTHRCECHPLFYRRLHSTSSVTKLTDVLTDVITDVLTDV